MACKPHNGTATATPSSGTSPYTYLWNDPLAQTTQTAVDLPAGTWSCLVTDADGCQDITQHIVTSVYGDAYQLETANGDILVTARTNHRIYKYKEEDATNFDYIFDETDNNFTESYNEPVGIAYNPSADGAGTPAYLVCGDGKITLYEPTGKLISQKTLSTGNSPFFIRHDAARNQYAIIDTSDNITIVDAVQLWNNAVATVESTAITGDATRGIILNSIDGKIYITEKLGSARQIVSYDIGEASITNRTIELSEPVGAGEYTGIFEKDDGSGNFYVIDKGSLEIKEFDTNLTLKSTKATSGLVDPQGLLITATHFYVADRSLVGVHKILR